MPVAGFIVLAIVSIAALVGINLQVLRWARRGLGLTPRWQGVLKAVLWASLAGMVLGRLAGRFWPNAGVTSVIAVSSTVELAVIISGLLLLMVDAAIFL